MTTGPNAVARRALLRWVGAGSIAALAGCTSNDDDGDGSGDEEPPEPDAVSIDEETTWRTASLTDVTTGEEYRIAEFDRPTLIHTFATDCAVCQSQHSEFGAFYANADVEIVELTIDPKDDPDDLRSYADEEGYDWRFGTVADEVTGDLSSDFGRDIYGSATSPVIIDCQNGSEVYTLEKVVDAEHLESILEDVCGSSASSDSGGSGDSTESNDSSDATA